MKINQAIKNLIKSPHKIIFGSLFSIVATCLFAIYNIYLGLKFGDSWGISISIYYVCLTVARIISITIERKIKNYSDSNKNVIRRKTYIGLSIFMFFIDFCLIAPTILMIVTPKEVLFGIIPAITVATYTTYKITIAIINYTKIRKVDNLTYKFLRELAIIDALISVLTLQHILIMVNGGMTKSMMILSACSSFGVLAIIIIFSIYTTIKNLKKFNYQYFNKNFYIK